MTQDVLLTISGLHDMAFADPEENEENEPIEVITPASYYWKNGKHYILYDEVMEGDSLGWLRIRSRSPVKIRWRS